MGIRLKLILIFVFFKIIPLLIVLYVAIKGATELNNYFEKNTKQLFSENKELIENTASKAIEDSIKSLNKTSQESLEKITVTLANSVAQFLYSVDSDILFLSTLPVSQKTYENFYKVKTNEVVQHENYFYDNKTNKWISTNSINSGEKVITTSKLKENSKEFHSVDPLNLLTKKLPKYKEITYFDLKGKELFKVSSINSKKLDISNKNNTYCKAEDYFSKIKTLKKGEIYVSDVIGAYVKSNIIGSFTKNKAKKANIEFTPELHGYAGLENPRGKRFEGIIRFVTPIFENGKKIAYLSLALDHRHIMEFTDTFNPIKKNMKESISNAGDGNYAFMMDYKARNISHPRDYFILGFDPKTGKRVPGWISEDLEKEFKLSGYNDLNQFLETYPKFHKQSLSKKPNILQLQKNGEVGIDCRYLNFAPQCQGWMEVTQNGGYGSFIIFWSNVWKLTTAATIPYYTGNYANTKRGFGFVTIGANLDQFHHAANETQDNIDNILKIQNQKLESSLEQNNHKISKYIDKMVGQLGVITIVMIILVVLLAIAISAYLIKKIQKLILATQEYSKNNLEYKIDVTSTDEIGKLELAFNDMSTQIKDAIDEQKQKDALLIQKTKMAEMGDMMSAIVHQWKQPLNSIVVSTSGTKLSLELGMPIGNKEIEDICDQIESQTTLMSQTLDDFKNFFKPANKEEYSAYDATSRVDRILGGTFKSFGVKIDYIQERNSLVLGYPTELMQVIINLLNNSKDAILENDVPLKHIVYKVTNDEHNCIIEIYDYAGGIPDDIIGKVFDPYFTTKTEDKGTGIGLHMSRNIIDKVDGTLEVENIISEVENRKYKGAKFTIKLGREL